MLVYNVYNTIQRSYREMFTNLAIPNWGITGITLNLVGGNVASNKPRKAWIQFNPRWRLKLFQMSGFRAKKYGVGHKNRLS